MNIFLVVTQQQVNDYMKIYIILYLLRFNLASFYCQTELYMYTFHPLSSEFRFALDTLVCSNILPTFASEKL